MATEELLLCYNKGCGQKFNPNENTDESCRYHPGGPIFHDALKGWSCCKKRSTDFSEFLAIPGCTKGRHSAVRPQPPTPQPDKTTSTTTKNNNTARDSTSVASEVILKPVTVSVRPSCSEPMLRLTVTVADSLRQALETHMKQLCIDTAALNNTTDVGQIQIGSSCLNKSCTAVYEGEQSNSETCHYHPGVPVFHEGMKFWSCCERKTTDFNAFLSQQGCADGRHVWTKKDEDGEEKVVCRYDWHQTGSFVTLSVFAKLTQPTKSWVEVNKVVLKVNIVFDGGKSHFEKTFTLNGTIDPDKSNVKMMGSKVEINMKKLDTGSWSALELPDNKTLATTPQTIS